MNQSYKFLYRLFDDKFRVAHHAVYIGIIVLFWTLFTVQRMHGLPDVLRLLLYSSTYIAIAYLNIYFLFRRFLLRGHVAAYTGLSLLSFVTSYLAQSVIYLSSWAQLRQDLTPSWPLFIDMMINSITYCMFIGIGLSAKVIKMWLGSELRVHSLEREKLKANLYHLKSQVSPHFLFNTFNNLYILTKTNPTIAAEMLLGFADLMRYQLSECERDKVGLEKEIRYIENFLELERLRKNELDLRIEYDRRELKGIEIEPLLFVTLVENAVKHGSQRMEKPFIHVHINRVDNNLNFMVRNSKPEFGDKDASTSLGRGLPNLRQRLDISYPGKHALHVEDCVNMYKAELEIHLS